jgi:hypothetical protein
MSAWLKRFGLHLAAAVGATGIFVAAAAVGASQTRQQSPTSPPSVNVVGRPTRVPQAQRTPTVEAGATSTPRQGGRQTPNGAAAVRPERSLAGTIRDVQPDALDIVGAGGRVWHVEPAPGALIRLNGKAARLDALQAGEGVVILGQAQPGPGQRFLAHAITAKTR